MATTTCISSSCIHDFITLSLVEPGDNNYLIDTQTTMNTITIVKLKFEYRF